jgi:N-acetylmuramoyl-L-alanine amidase
MIYRRILQPSNVPKSQALNQNQPLDKISHAVDILARTIWGEARGEPLKGQAAIAHVVLNRRAVAKQYGRFWWGSDVIEICQKLYQFSCWLEADPNLAKLLMVNADDFIFASCLRIARRAVNGVLNDDPTDGATHYHARQITPHWAKGRAPLAEIGNHIFYRILD